MNNEKWVSCNERLPEKMVDVLVTQEYYDLDLEEYCVDVNTACLDPDGDWCSVFSEENYEEESIEDWNVIAWMPLPKPYECK